MTKHLVKMAVEKSISQDNSKSKLWI